jgi:hypothetical protein
MGLTLRRARAWGPQGVLRTEKQNFLLFDMATHPLSNMTVKDELVRRVVDTLLRYVCLYQCVCMCISACACAELYKSVCAALSTYSSGPCACIDACFFVWLWVHAHACLYLQVHVRCTD